MVNWMIFRPEGTDVLYLWNGELVIPVHVATHEGEPKDWLWANYSGHNLDDKEITILTSVAETKRKRVFSVPRKGKRQYQVISRGTYEYVNK